jgi:hypothetical protein
MMAILGMRLSRDDHIEVNGDATGRVLRGGEDAVEIQCDGSQRGHRQVIDC